MRVAAAEGRLRRKTFECADPALVALIAGGQDRPAAAARRRPADGGRLVGLWQLGIIPLLLGLGVEVVTANIDIVRFLVAATAILLITVPVAFVIIFMEMKVIAFLASRVGPNRTGPWGTLVVGHSTASRCWPRRTSRRPAPTRPVFTLAPVVTYLAAVLTLLVIPFAPGLVGLDMNIGLLYFFAVSVACPWSA